jgi:hypothetical protein
MKKFIMMLLVSLVLISCGKKDSVASIGYSTSPIASINADGNFQALGKAIASNSFGAYVNAQYFTEYHFADVINTCVDKKGWFGINYTSCTGAQSNATTVIHGQVVVATKQAELNAILAKTVEFQANGLYYSLRTSDNITYVIRTDYPIQANPVYTYNNVTYKANQLMYIKL